MASTNLSTRISQKRDTTANWEAHDDFVGLAGELLIYDDKYQDAGGNAIPGIKIGDGVTTVGNLPFVGENHADKSIIVINDTATDDTKILVDTEATASDVLLYTEEDSSLKILAQASNQVQVKTDDGFVTLGLLAGGGSTSVETLTNDDIDTILDDIWGDA